MQSIRVAAVSMNSELGKPSQVLDAIAAWCGKAKAEGAELALFPELVVPGHCTPNTWEIAEAIPDGPSVRTLVSLARQHGLCLSAGLAEKERDIVYNTQVLVGPQGYIGKQRKIHLSRDEVLHYKGGKELPVFDLGKCRVGIVICYDNMFPELARILALRGADVLLMPHAARIKMWDDTAESEAAARRHSFDFLKGYALRARENACFAVLADQAGRAGYVDAYPRNHPNQPHHAGAVIVFGPDGEVIAHAQTERIRDEMVVATLDAGALAQERSQPNYPLRTRRPELFGELARDQVSA
jgi:N-carbamoylputrescine amidase